MEWGAPEGRVSILPGRVLTIGATRDAAQREPTVTVVVNAYNQASLLGEALDSLVAQARQADEVIVVDDASADDVAAVCARSMRRGGHRRLRRRSSPSVSCA